jgi:tRNA pseudouridine13 synthase
MALREVTKTETSASFQSALTAKSEDQKFRGSLVTAEAEVSEKP